MLASSEFSFPLLTVVAIHAGVDNGLCCDLKHCVLPAVPVIDLIKCEGLGWLLV